MEESSSGLGAPNATNRNARLAHIRKFVCSPPERGHTLRLLEVADPPTTLGEWPKTSCVDNAATAADVDALVRDHANTMGYEIQANLVWTSETGLVVVSKRLRCKPDPVDAASLDPSLMAQSETLGITGSAQGWMIQQQRALEAHARLYMSGHQTQLAQASAQARDARELAGLLGSLLKDSWAAAHAANVQLDLQRAQQRKELDQAAKLVREATDAAAGDEESSQRAELMEMIGGALSKALPFIVQHVGKMMTEPAPANTNATPADVAAAE